MTREASARHARDAMAYLERGEIDKVHGSALKSILEDPSACDLYGPLISRLLCAGKPEAAERIAREGTAQCNDPSADLENTAACLRAQLRGDLEGAALLLRRAVERSDDPVHATNLGVIRWQQGRPVEAAGLWTQVLTRGGPYKRAEYLLSALQAGRNRVPSEAARHAGVCWVFPLLAPSFVPDLEGPGGDGVRMQLRERSPEGWTLACDGPGPAALAAGSGALAAAWDAEGLWVGHGRVESSRMEGGTCVVVLSIRQVRFVQRRRSVRVPGDAFCTARLILAAREGGGTAGDEPQVVDVSAGGMRLRVADPEGLAQAVQVELKMGESVVIRTAAALRRTIRRLTGHEIALEFLAAPKVLEEIAHRVHQQQLERARGRVEPRRK